MTLLGLIAIISLSILPAMLLGLIAEGISRDYIESPWSFGKVLFWGYISIPIFAGFTYLFVLITNWLNSIQIF